MKSWRSECHICSSGLSITHSFSHTHEWHTPGGRKIKRLWKGVVLAGVAGVGCLHPPPGQQRSPAQMHPTHRFMTFHAVRQKRSESKELRAKEDVWPQPHVKKRSTKDVSNKSSSGQACFRHQQSAVVSCETYISRDTARADFSRQAERTWGEKHGHRSDVAPTLR